MVGPVSPRVTSESLTNDGHRIEKPRWQALPWGAHQYNLQTRPHQTKYYAGGDSGKRNSQRSMNGADNRVGGLPDVVGRVNIPSTACSSGQSSSQSNLDRFLEETSPRVKTQTLPKVVISRLVILRYNFNWPRWHKCLCRLVHAWGLFTYAIIMESDVPPLVLWIFSRHFAKKQIKSDVKNPQHSLDYDVRFFLGKPASKISQLHGVPWCIAYSHMIVMRC